jgi:hypothetical protein
MVSHRFLVAVYSAVGCLHLVDVDSVTSKTRHMEAKYTSETLAKSQEHNKYQHYIIIYENFNSKLHS